MLKVARGGMEEALVAGLLNDCSRESSEGDFTKCG